MSVFFDSYALDSKRNPTLFLGNTRNAGVMYKFNALIRTTKLDCKY